MGRKAPRPAPSLPRHVQARRVPRKHRYVSRRSATPFMGVREKPKNKIRAHKTRSGNEEDCLNMVTYAGCPHPEERAYRRRPANATARARVSRDEDGPCPSRFETQAVEAPRSLR